MIRTYKAEVIFKNGNREIYEDCIEHTWMDDTGMVLIRTPDRILIHNMVDVTTLVAHIPIEPLREEVSSCGEACDTCSPEEAARRHAEISRPSGPPPEERKADIPVPQSEPPRRSRVPIRNR